MGLCLIYKDLKLNVKMYWKINGFYSFSFLITSFSNWHRCVRAEGIVGALPMKPCKVLSGSDCL